MPMLELDQSGKVEQLNTLTVVAVSDGTSIVISAQHKRKVINVLRMIGVPNKYVAPLFFAMLVYLLLSRIQIRNIIVIDEEYTGHANLIENVLGQLSKSAAALQHGILFNQIGKLSRAHHYAWTGYRSKGRGLAKVKDTEVLSLVSRLDFQNLFVGGLHQL